MSSRVLTVVVECRGKINTFRSKCGADLCETKISESAALAESPFAEKDVFDHALVGRRARDYQALYDELKSNDFLQPNLQQMPKPPLVGHAGVFLAGTLHQLAAFR